ncbi:YkvA family protein [Rhodoglobus aureus]
MEWWHVLVSVAGGLLLLWLALIGALAWISRGHSEVPKGVRIWLVVLLVYLLLPIDLVPDFIPVVGYVDDAIVVALVLRFATKNAGAAALDRHWPGTPQGLSALRTFVGLS